MKVGWIFRISGITLILASTTPAQPFSMNLQSTGASVQLRWPSSVLWTNQTEVYPEYQVQYSSNLLSWKPVPGKIVGIPGRSGPQLSVSFDTQPGPLFYRIRTDMASQPQNETGDGGAEVFGYDNTFATELLSLRALSQDDFATNGAATSYLPQLSWDPTTAMFWTNFQLTSNELAVFTTNGFVVSERRASQTFGDAYYGLFNLDLPSFVTADSVLHAWHRSYQSMLEELEEAYLSTLFSGMLSNMSAQLPRTWSQCGNGPLKDSILDADYFLTTALSLWTGQQMPSALGNPQVDANIGWALSAISRLDLEQAPLFGGSRMIDFSQFKVRGHYDASDRLRKYFRSMMWCGRIDMRVATFPPNKEDDIRQLGTTVVLNYLLSESGQFTNWFAIESISEAFVGTTDSMTFAQLRDLLRAAGIRSPADIQSMEVLTNLQTRLLTGELGVQSIHADYFLSPLGSEQVKLPRSFTVCGQKFIMDSWALTQVVYDHILSPDEEKILRRRCSSLDVAFSVLGNDSTVPEISARMAATNGESFRDGLPYHQNLLAARRTIDAQQPEAWTNSVYNAWLDALRALSAPTTAPKYPEAMRTRAWAMKNLNTQLGSLTQLRHDNLLYAKQSYTVPGLCGYPAGFVEPRPEFWNKMKILADVSANGIAAFPMSGQVSIPSRIFPSSYIYLDLGMIRQSQVGFAQNFASVMATLEAMAQEESDQLPFTLDQSEFLKNIVEDTKVYTGYRQYNGWYPGLFYAGHLGGSSAIQLPGCIEPDLLVADVHTDLPDENVNDPGVVLHEAVGNVNFLVIAIDNGPDRMVYGGPVFSHYEFEMPGVTRLSDSDWQALAGSSQKPPAPDWTRCYLVPLKP